MKRIAGILMAMFVSAGLCLAGDTADAKIEVSGRAALENGQIVNGHFHSKTIPWRLWINRAYVNIHLKSDLGERFRIAAEPEVRIWFNNYPFQTNYIGGDHTGLPFRQFSTVLIAEGQGIYSFFGNDNPYLQFAAGIFPFKYNRDAHNLGEYLFRTGAYVPYVQTGFEFQFARLSGFRLSSSVLGERLKQNLILYTETQIQPLQDWSLAYCANASVHGIDLGAGASLHRYFPVSKKLSQPKTDINNRYLTETGDTTFFSFKGIKLIGMAAVDAKAFFPASLAEKFGKNELRFYAEAAVLGVKNYPAFVAHDTVLTPGGPSVTTFITDTNKNFYADRSQRIPIMVGFTFPTLGLFDNVSLEIERYTWPEKNVYYDQGYNSENPRPPLITSVSQYTKEDYKYGSWKWSLNATKTLTKGFSLIGQVARDHMRYDIYYEKNRDEEDAFTKSHEWYWMFRVNYAF